MSVVAAIEHTLCSMLGLKPRPGAASQLERTLRQLREQSGLEPEQIAQRLEREPWLVKRLVGALTVDETFFLRHPEHFDALTAHLRERLASDNSPVMLWSAGCAGGEEPYSMAIALHRVLGGSASARTKILASDISEAALERAKRGVYGHWSFRGATELTQSPYFARTPRDREFQIKPALLASVAFKHSSLEQQLAELPASSMDVVFFRNVAIYLNDDALRRIYAGFSRVLRDDGILVIAPADPRPGSEQLGGKRIGDVPVYSRRAARESVEPNAAKAPSRSAQPSKSRSRTPVDRTAGDHSLAHRAQQLADRGLVSEALSTLDARLASRPDSGELLALRGRIQLARGQAEASERDLRAALAVLPERPLLRFHRALALEVLQQRYACRQELQELLALLAPRDESELLDDATSVRSLRQAAHELLRRME